MSNYYKNNETAKEYIKLSEGINGKKIIEQLKDFLPKSANLLEVGSGPGSDWKLLNQFFEVVGSDNSEVFLKYLQSENPNGHFLELDAISLIVNENFEGIYSNKVLHHLRDEELKLSIKRQSEILTNNGIICHTFWRGEGSEIFKGLFVNYHTEEAIRHFFETYFEVLILSPYNEFDENDSLLLIAKKK